MDRTACLNTVMKLSEIITEAASLVFDQAKVVRHENSFNFKLPIEGGGCIIIDAKVILSRRILVSNIWTQGVIDRDDTFKPSYQSHAIGVRLGTTMIKKLLHFVVDRIKQDYPNVDMIMGDRLTGARAGGGITMQSL
jgi:hypothetical protein